MAKSGQRSTHRVQYVWENGVKGAFAVYSLDQAEMKVEEIHRTAENRDMSVKVLISER